MNQYRLFSRHAQRYHLDLPHHNTSHGNERSGGETPFLSTQQTSDGDIATSTELTISLDNNTATKVVQNQGLMGLGKTQLPRQTSVLDTSPSGSTSTTIVTRDQDVVGSGLCDTRSDDTDTSFRDKLD